MNLQQITTDLDRTLRRRLRRSGTLDRWAATDQRLTGTLDDLYRRVQHQDRDVSYPTLAALVDLARAGDADAAEVATVALLERFVAKERTRRGRDWDQFVGHLYEAVVTCHSTQSRTLKEIIERNAVRRNLRMRIAESDTVHLSWEDTLASTEPSPESVAMRRDARWRASQMISELCERRAVTPATRRILHHIAAGTDRSEVPEFDGRCANTIRTRCRRAAQSLRNEPLLHTLRSALLS